MIIILYAEIEIKTSFFNYKLHKNPREPYLILFDI